MASIVDYTYPQIVWRNKEKRLWNPIHRKALKNRPEERVRLRTIEYLLQAGWSKHRISTEESIGRLTDTSMRTDIIGYSNQFKPRLLVECKAENIPISAKTAEQTARYNQNVGAPYLLMTNGISDFWHRIEKDSSRIRQLESPPDFLGTRSERPAYYFDDWKDRGFAGSKARPGLRLWFKELLPALWFPKEMSSIRFLNFNQSLADINLSHYYHIHSLSTNRLLAISTLNTAYGGSRLVAIFNEKKENRGIIEINLDLLFAEENKNSSVYSEAGISTFDLNTSCDLPATTNLTQIIKYMEQLYFEYFGV